MSVKPIEFVTKRRPFIENFSWRPELGTLFTVVDRESGALVGRYRTKPFFAFHHANAFERDGRLYFDLVVYDDTSIITETATYFRQNGGHTLHHNRLERFSLELKSGEVVSTTLLEGPVEFPRINGRYDGHPYRHLYLADPREPVEKENARGLYKVDVETHELQKWEEEGCCPGEPVFAASPHSAEEDEGVVLAVVLDLRKRSSFLLVLDGKSFEEIGRAFVPHAIPPGLHGQYFDRYQ
jgi:beta,beta-carotene 9',10'-dioxygenase